MTAPRPLEADDLYQLRLLTDPQISPDGCLVAFVLSRMDQEKNDYISNVYVADREGKITQFTSGDKDSAPRWSPDGAYLAFLSARKDRAQIHLLRTAGGESVALTDLPLGAGVPKWSPDSKLIAFTGQVSTEPEEDGKDGEKKDKAPAKTKITDRASYKLDGAGYIGNRRRHLFLIDVESRQVDQLTEGDFHNDDAAWSPDGQHLAFSSDRETHWDISTHGDIYLIPRAGGDARRLTEGGAYGRPGFSPDGSRVAFLGHQDPEEAFAPGRIYSVDRSGSDLRDELGEWDGDQGNQISSDVVRSYDQVGLTYFWQPDGIYFLGTERGVGNIYRANGGTVQPMTSGRHAIADFSMADGAIAYTCADATHPAEVYLLSDGEATQLTHENDALLSEVYVASPERICFAGARGEESEGWLLPPRGHEFGKHPLIVYIHGGPHFAHGETFFFEYQFLAGQGFGVFYPNIHGSSSYGRSYYTSIRGDWGNLDFQDVLAGAEAAASRPWVDEHRLGIAGGSYGGYMTGWVMGHSDRFRAALSERCLCNMVSFMGTSDHGWLWNRAFGVYPEQDIQKLWDMSPIKYVANVQAPVLVMHSEGDDRTPLEQGEQLFNALRRLGKETRLVVFPEESHGLSRMGKPSRRAERLGHILSWFRQYL